MGRIQSSVGLVTGFPIESTVDKLIALAGRPRDLLTQRNTALQEQQVALAQISGLVLGVQSALARLKTVEPFQAKTATSQDESLLTAAITGNPEPGLYQFTPVQQAQAHQLISSGLASPDQPLGEGTLSLRFGGLVDESICALPRPSMMCWMRSTATTRSMSPRWPPATPSG
jgi:flagellar hook-associated protein 2